MFSIGSIIIVIIAGYTAGLSQGKISMCIVACFLTILGIILGMIGTAKNKKLLVLSILGILINSIALMILLFHVIASALLGVNK